MIRVIPIQTGTVHVKDAQRCGREGRSALQRKIDIFRDTRWVGPLPIFAYLIEHPEGRFLVDTGASDIVLSPSDAKRLGVDVAQLQFTQDYETANGVGRGAPYTIERLTVGPVLMTVVPASINQTPMESSLLGMTFLKRLDGFEVRGRKLYLRWHGK